MGVWDVCVATVEQTMTCEGVTATNLSVALCSMHIVGLHDACRDAELALAECEAALSCEDLADEFGPSLGCEDEWDQTLQVCS